uniref:Uncharacterized protein LOC104233725 n=1 Tax=Nicotiana sylvestris TaxID=4096 RepID=A0A1U7X706_NICSY|nr:PREDICTED: uncharacterized protein LOC104233725 [Nicotiana sylvestris]
MAICTIRPVKLIKLGRNLVRAQIKSGLKSGDETTKTIRVISRPTLPDSDQRRRSSIILVYKVVQIRRFFGFLYVYSASYEVVTIIIRRLSWVSCILVVDYCHAPLCQLGG